MSRTSVEQTLHILDNVIGIEVDLQDRESQKMGGYRQEGGDCFLTCDGITLEWEVIRFRRRS